MTDMMYEQQIVRLRARVLRLEMTLGTLIGWMAQSANSPLRLDEARILLAALEADPADHRKEGA
jgi:hypothetical protein